MLHCFTTNPPSLPSPTRWVACSSRAYGDTVHSRCSCPVGIADVQMNVHTHTKMQQHVGKRPRLRAGEKEIAVPKATTALPVMHISAIAQGLISNHDASVCTTKSSPNDQFGWRVGSVRVKSTSSAQSRGGRVAEVESAIATWDNAAVEISMCRGCEKHTYRSRRRWASRDGLDLCTHWRHS